MPDADGNVTGGLRPPWKPGESGNPAGPTAKTREHRALGQLIRERTREGLELVEFHLAVFRCEKVAVGNGAGSHAADKKYRQRKIRRYPSLGERRASAKWLTEYLVGKPRMQLEVEGRGVQPIFIVRPEDVPAEAAVGNGHNGHHGNGAH